MELHGRRQSLSVIELPPQRDLQEMFSYDETTGELRWKVRPNRSTPVGSLVRCLQVQIRGRAYMRHRIIWKMVTGQDPDGTIDHRDRNQDNNRWSNLRDATPSQQAINRVHRMQTRTGVRGVFLPAGRRRFRAVIWAGGKAHHLGVFDTKEEAAEVYSAASARLHGDWAVSPAG